MRYKYLVITRRSLGIFVLLISFLSFTGLGIYLLDTVPVLSLQFTAVLSQTLIGAISGLLILFLLVAFTIFFGRIYCSTICPLGLLQDLFLRLELKSRKSKSKLRKFPGYNHSRSHNVIRYSFLVLYVLAIIGLAGGLLSFLDPYGNFGRIASLITGQLVPPAYNSIDDLLNLGLAHMKPISYTYGVTLFTVAFFFLLLVSTKLWGRVFCNTVCPVGTILGIISRLSIYKLRTDRQTCVSCGKCAKRCKSSAFDTETFIVQEDRCVRCFNCLDTCPTNSLSFSIMETSKDSDNTRRKVLTTLALGALAKPLMAAENTAKKAGLSVIPHTDTKPAMPPGALTLEKLEQSCVGCNLCVSTCPSNVLSTGGRVYSGASTFLLPTMNYDNSYCQYECNDCTQVCPTGALTPLALNRKKLAQLGEAVFIKDNCVVITKGKDCGACAEHCPTKAVIMQPYQDGLRIPTVDNKICIGCGACQHACPTIPYKAIYVKGHEVQQKAMKFTDEAVKAPPADEDFPF